MDLDFGDVQKARSAVSKKVDAMAAKRKDWARIGELYAAMKVLDKEISEEMRRWDD
jgi:hypothetical protein